MNMNKLTLSALGMFLALSPVFAFDDDNNQGLQATPSVFVGTAPGCAPSPPGSNIVTSAWLTGMGLPDNGTSNLTPSTPPNRDPHYGLLLSKNGATGDCSAAGADITGAAGMVATEFGFDYRIGGHCGAGAPRFNLVTNDNVFHFIGGCSNGTKTPAPQDPTQWMRVRFSPTNLAQAFPPVAPGAKIKTLSIIFDEGTDSNGAPTDDPNGIGLAVVDNIDVNGKLITRGPANGNNDDKSNNKNE
jgi:hypothetical protein